MPWMLPANHVGYCTRGLCRSCLEQGGGEGREPRTLTGKMGREAPGKPGALSGDTVALL